MKEKKKTKKKKRISKKETVNRTRGLPLTARGQPDSLRPCDLTVRRKRMYARLTIIRFISHLSYTDEIWPGGTNVDDL
jgi:hypothetical protein